MQSQQLIDKLKSQTQHIKAQAQLLKAYDATALHWRKYEGSWNILECLAHLNFYAQHYLSAIETQIKKSTTKAEPEFKPGFFGNYFANSMLPKEKLNKMKTLKSTNFVNATLSLTIIDDFILHQDKLLQLLDLASNVSLNKIKIPLSLAKILKFKLGDTFNFYVNHMIRHMHQIDKVKKAMNATMLS